MAKSWLNMDFHLFFGFSHFKLAFWVDYPRISHNLRRKHKKLRCRKRFQEILCNFLWISQSLLSFGCDCVWKLVRVRISAEIRSRSIVRIMNELTLTIWRIPPAGSRTEARAAREGTQIVSCISDMLASGAEGPLGVLGAHICTG